MRTIGRPLYKTIGKYIGNDHLGALVSYLKWFLGYKTRVEADSGTVQDETVSKQILRHLQNNGLYNNTKLLLCAKGGLKTRASGVSLYVPKVYDMGGADEVYQDATQTTESLQPALGGNIAPNELQCFRNVNGEARYLSHPKISFASNEAWSITTVLNSSGNDIREQQICGNALKTDIRIRDNKDIWFINDVDTISFWNDVVSTGKIFIITLVAGGDGNISFFINGEFVSQKSISTVASFAGLYYSRDGNGVNLKGTINAHIIHAQALTAAQVSSCATFLRSLFPEIPTVQIGTENVATSNFEAVASSNGTVITQAADNADWATGAARWCYHNADPSRGAIFGKLYNKAARDIIIANPPSGWHVATEAELTALAALGGNALKYVGTDYWNTTGGTNSSGFTALGGSSRNADGTFNAIGDYAGFWCADSDKVLKVYHNNDTAEVVAVTSVNEGFSIRLVKD